MDDGELSRLQNWFDQYVKGFYGIDTVVDANVELKEQHTRNTCGEIRYIASELKLSRNDCLIAQTIGLFHDLGRFEQFRRFRTFVDGISLNHACYSVSLLQEMNLLANLPPEEQETVFTAIHLHNVKALPAHLAPQVLLHARLIRDADKIDIYRVFHDYSELLRDDSESLRANLGLPVTPEFTPSILCALTNRMPIDYGELRTSTDVTLLHLAWVYDINCVPGLRRIKECGHLAWLISHLPDRPELKAAAETVFAYVDRQITSGSTLVENR